MRIQILILGGLKGNVLQSKWSKEKTMGGGGGGVGPRENWPLFSWSHLFTVKEVSEVVLDSSLTESRMLFFREARANKRRQYKCICQTKKILVWLSLVRPKMMSLGVETQILRYCCLPILGLVNNFPWVSYPVFHVEKPFMNNDYWASQLDIFIKMFIKATKTILGPS